jgi:hypothetical protein
MTKLTLIHKLVGCNNEDLEELEDSGFMRVGETRHIVYYAKGHQFALYDKREQKVVRRFETRPYKQ